jgi:hypothetical protein
LRAYTKKLDWIDYGSEGWGFESLEAHYSFPQELKR